MKGVPVKGALLFFRGAELVIGITVLGDDNHYTIIVHQQNKKCDSYSDMPLRFHVMAF